MNALYTITHSPKNTTEQIRPKAPRWARIDHPGGVWFGTPTAFLGTLQKQGLQLTDTLPRRATEVAAQILTHSNQLGLIPDATLAAQETPISTTIKG